MGERGQAKLGKENTGGLARVRTLHHPALQLRLPHLSLVLCVLRSQYTMFFSHVLVLLACPHHWPARFPSLLQETFPGSLSAGLVLP